MTMKRMFFKNAATLNLNVVTHTAPQPQEKLGDVTNVQPASGLTRPAQTAQLAPVQPAAAQTVGVQPRTAPAPVPREKRKRDEPKRFHLAPCRDGHHSDHFLGHHCPEASIRAGQACLVVGDHFRTRFCSVQPTWRHSRLR